MGSIDNRLDRGLALAKKRAAEFDDGSVSFSMAQDVDVPTLIRRAHKNLAQADAILMSPHNLLAIARTPKATRHVLGLALANLCDASNLSLLAVDLIEELRATMPEKP